MTQYVHLVCGGGLGDAIRELWYHNTLGTLKRWKQEHPRDQLRLLVVSHNPATADLLRGQDWIDEVVVRPYPVDKYWDWWHHYEEFAADFADALELRVLVPDHRSNHAAKFQAHRPPKAVVARCPATSWIPWLSDDEQAQLQALRAQRPVLAHFGAGSHERGVPPNLQKVLRAQHPDLRLIGANYARTGHRPEDGLTLSPRLLLHLLPACRGVIGSESSVWYAATMVGTPSYLLYRPEFAYGRMQAGHRDWDWFFAPDTPPHRAANLNTTPQAAICADVAQWLAAADPSTRSPVGAVSPKV